MRNISLLQVIEVEAVFCDGERFGLKSPPSIMHDDSTLYSICTSFSVTITLYSLLENLQDLQQRRKSRENFITTVLVTSLFENSTSMLFPCFKSI